MHEKETSSAADRTLRMNAQTQCSNYMQARVCRAPSLLVRAPILGEIFGVQRGPKLRPPHLRLWQVHMSGRQLVTTQLFFWQMNKTKIK